jgi:hypothetical protein
MSRLLDAAWPVDPRLSQSQDASEPAGEILCAPSFFAFAAIALLGQPAFGKTRFEAYEGRQSVRDGEGGTRVTKDGIDFWTNGDPPRRQQIIGIISDNRGTGPLHGDAIGSSSVAKAAKAAGGNAVIVMSRDTESKGIYAGGSQGSAFAVPIEERTTKFIVVKYLDSGPSSWAPPLL